MEKIVKFGTLWTESAPVNPGISTGDVAISIRDTIPGMELSWVKACGLLVSQTTIVTDISWSWLRTLRLIFGRPIRIDGRPYLIRCLKLGNEAAAPNEWGNILKATTRDDTLWHWKRAFFWGQEASKKQKYYRVMRGYASANSWNEFSNIQHAEYIGFRPVLESLPAGPSISDAMIGKTVKVYTPNGYVTGVLRDITCYDLVIDKWRCSKSPKIDSARWNTEGPDNTLFIDRNAVVYFNTREKIESYEWGML